MGYKVIICPDAQCRGVNIVQNDGSDTALCSKCNSQYSFERYKVSFETDSHDDAVAARTKLLTKLNDDDVSFEEIKEKGYLQDPDRVFSKRSERESRSIKEIVRDNLRDINEPTREEIIESSTQNKKVDHKKAEKAVDVLIREGEVIDYGSHLRLI